MRVDTLVNLNKEQSDRLRTARTTANVAFQTKITHSYSIFIHHRILVKLTTKEMPLPLDFEIALGFFIMFMYSTSKNIC
jgi:hypothetical protein